MELSGSQLHIAPLQQRVSCRSPFFFSTANYRKYSLYTSVGLVQQQVSISS